MVYRRGALLKGLSILQIYLIIISVFSFAFLIGETSKVAGQGRAAEIGFGSSTPKTGPEAFQSSGYTGTPSGGTSWSEGVKNWWNKVTGGSKPDTPKEPPAPQKITATPPAGANPSFTGGKIFSGVNPKTTFNIPGAGNVEASRIGSMAQVGDKYAILDAEKKQIGDLLTKEQASQFENAVAEQGGQLTGQYTGTFLNGGFGYLTDGLLFAGAVVGAIQLIGGLAGWDKSLTDSLSIAAGAGIMATSLINSLGPSGFGAYTTPFTETFAGLTGAGWIGVGVAVVAFALLYKKESAKIVNFQCLPYEAPIGGKNCEKCNGDMFRPCSEYRCKALGQTCELVNVGSNDEKCVAVNPNDALSPTITPWTMPLTENHRYTSHATRPASLGTKIVLNGATDGCIKAFTPLTFGITTNEPAQCKIDLEHKKTLDEMQFFFGNTNLYLYNHTQQFSLPSPGALNTELPELQNDGKYDFFVRCRDKNGNENVDEFAVQFCVDPSPDTTAPVIMETSIPTDSYVKFGVGSVPLQVYVNEPATCKWSTQNKEYSVMENTMNCATNLTQINARELYTCFTNLTGVVDRQENKFFFRCKDQPNKPEEDRNVNVNSYPFNLRGSQPLNIISVAPNGTATGNTNTVPVNLKVVTDDGANEGTAICSFSSTGLPNSYVLMFETKAVEHTQRLDLTTGNYNYRFRCVDYGGNAAEASVNFSVIVDTAPPLVTRAYYDSTNIALKIVTNEDAVCAYSLNSCNFNFEEGIELIYSQASKKKSHFGEWKPNMAYYIKCKDSFDNEPAPNACSIVVSATNIA